MKYFYSSLGIGTLLFLFFFSSIALGQRTYRESRVENGKVVTDYRYDNLPEKKPPMKRAYREGGKIKYYDDDDRRPSSSKGKPYRDDSGRIRYR